MERHDVTLVMIIKGARKLKSTQKLGLQDPYLRAWVTGSKKEQLIRTKTYVDGGSMAVWNEKCEIRVQDKKSDCLFIEVKNENDFTSDATIGRLKLPCYEIPEAPIEDWYSIFGENGVTSGEVHLSLSMSRMNDDVSKRRIKSDRVSSRTYNVDNPKSLSTNSSRDSSSSGADLAGGLPTGWTVMHTPTGCPYFFNSDLRTTTWIHPAEIKT